MKSKIMCLANCYSDLAELWMSGRVVKRAVESQAFFSRNLEQNQQLEYLNNTLIFGQMLSSSEKIEC